jgi:hypothetical protein
MATTVKGSARRGRRQSHNVGSNKGPVVEHGTTPGGNGEGVSSNMKGSSNGVSSNVKGNGGASGFEAGPKSTPKSIRG